MNEASQYQQNGCCDNGCLGFSGRCVGCDDVTNDTEAVLAKEMNELSFHEREKVFEEIHGVAKSQEETPEFRAKSIGEFDKAVAQLFKRQRKALDRAYFLKPSIQTDDEFKLLFLRADLFNSARAANRMAAYFDLKFELFGEEKLAKDITHEDLTDLELKTSFKLLGMLPQRDRSGRPMHIVFPNKFQFDLPVDCMRRGVWYQAMNLLSKDEAASKKGVVSIMYSRGPVFKAEWLLPRMAQLSFQAGHMMNCLPVRYNCYHYCYDNPDMKLMLGAIQKGIGKKLRVRLRTHCGSPIEIRYSLLTFGIDCGDIIEASYEETLDMIERHHHKGQVENYKREQRRREEQEASSGVIPYPNPNDVLIGRGHFFAQHSGNRRFHLLVDSKLDLYLQSNNRSQKTAISTDVVQAVQESNGRFLAPTKDGWEVIDNSLATKKTAVAFRSFKRRLRS